MAITTVKKLNLPLPAEMHKALFKESREMGVPTTRLVRSVLEEWLRERLHARQKDQIRRYAEKWGGTRADLDSELEAAGIEELLQVDRDETR